MGGDGSGEVDDEEVIAARDSGRKRRLKLVLDESKAVRAS
jgi:hypothetical protein